MQRAQRGRGSAAAVLAAMQQAEERHERGQSGASKRARLLQKLEGGGGGSTGPSSSANTLTDALLQTAARQLAAVLGKNVALAAEAGGDVAGVAAALVQQLAAGGPSKPIFQGKLSNLAMLLRKAGSAADVPALAKVLGCAGTTQQAAQAAVQAAPAAAAQAAACDAPTAGALPQQQFQQQVDHAVALASSAAPAPSSGSNGSEPAAAAAAALHALAAAEVTVDLLAATGAGRKVQQLKRHAVPAVAAAAAEVVAAWKARLKAAGGQ